MRRPALLLTTLVSATALAGVLTAGVAMADPTPTPTSGPTPSASAAPTPGGSTSKGAGKRHRDLAHRALHGEVTLGDKKHRVVDFQRGTVSAVSDSAIRVHSADGFDATYVVNAKTSVRVAKAKAAIGDVAAGDRVRVVATRNGQTLTADRVVDRRK